MRRPVKILLAAGARPNFMKIAPLQRQLRQEPTRFLPILVHTGQHYDRNLSEVFFRDLELPEPDEQLAVGSGTHAEQTAGVMAAFERVCLRHRPGLVVVAGDVNSTLGCALAAVKLGLPVAHVEAGLRSRDRSMPEEINRLVTDCVSDLLFTPSADADENLLLEGCAASKIHRVGNILIDTLELLRPRFEEADTSARLGLEPGRYGLATLHRPANVDERDALERIVEALASISSSCKVVFPVHPRTRKSLERFGLMARLQRQPSLRLLEPLGPIEFLHLTAGASFVITDSGGIQEETTYLRIPCLTLRPNTERPITVSQGTNELLAPEGLEAAVSRVLAGAWKMGRVPELWDGRTAQRIADVLGAT